MAPTLAKPQTRNRLTPPWFFGRPANAGGLHFVDISDPRQPVLRQTLHVSVGQVEIFEGIAYAAVGDSVLALDALTSEEIQRLSLGGGNLTSIARDGTTLFTIDNGNRLRAIDLSSGTMMPWGSVGMPTGGGKLFVGGGIAYVGTAFGDFQGGFATANVSNLDELSVAIGAGIAFVADGTAGLQVVNYRAFDNQGQPPTGQCDISISANHVTFLLWSDTAQTLVATVSDAS